MGAMRSPDVATVRYTCLAKQVYETGTEVRIAREPEGPPLQLFDLNGAAMMTENELPRDWEL